MASIEKITIKRVDKQKVPKAQLSQQAIIPLKENGLELKGIRVPLGDKRSATINYIFKHLLS